jgi:hypothetical protein
LWWLVVVVKKVESAMKREREREIKKREDCEHPKRHGVAEKRELYGKRKKSSLLSHLESSTNKDRGTDV